TPLSLFETLLHSLHVEGYHPFDLEVWDPAAQRPGAVSFVTTDGPAPLSGWHVRFDGKRWNVAHDGTRVSQSDPAESWSASLVSLYRVLTPARDAKDSIYVTLDGRLSMADLALAIEVLGLDGPMPSIEDRADLNEILTAHGGSTLSDDAPIRVLVVPRRPANREP